MQSRGGCAILLIATVLTREKIVMEAKTTMFAINPRVLTMLHCIIELSNEILTPRRSHDFKMHH